MIDNNITISIDAMGGDNAPNEIVKGAVNSVNKNNDLSILLVGDESQIKNALSMLGPSALEFIESNRITVVPSEGVIKDGEQPVIGLKKKPKSSIAVSSFLVKNKKANGLLSMGSTGATMAASALTLGMMNGIERPTVGGPIIGSSPNTVILDIGANVDCKPSQLVTFAVLGSIYSKYTFEIDSPRVAILNVGSEKGKGNKLTKDTFELIENTNLNFVGNIEPNDLFYDKAEVVVCDGFVGNILLKLLESAGFLIKDFIEEQLDTYIDQNTKFEISNKALNYLNVGETYGVAPLFGVNGVVGIGHGKANHKTVEKAINSIILWIKSNMIEEMNKEINHLSTEKTNEKQ